MCLIHYLGVDHTVPTVEQTDISTGKVLQRILKALHIFAMDGWLIILSQCRELVIYVLTI